MNTSFIISEEMRIALKEISKKEERSVGSIIRLAIKKYLEDKGIKIEEEKNV